MDLSLEVGTYCRRGSEPKQIKWKMYLEVNGDDSALTQIRVKCMERLVLVVKWMCLRRWLLSSLKLCQLIWWLCIR
jgi:hypothetical protein